MKNSISQAEKHRHGNEILSYVQPLGIGCRTKQISGKHLKNRLMVEHSEGKKWRLAGRDGWIGN